MTQIIKPKRGTTVPTTSDLVNGEIAVNTNNQRIYINDNGTIKEIGDGGTQITTAKGNFDLFPRDSSGTSVSTVETNNCRYFRTATRCQLDCYVNKITKGSVSGTSPVRMVLSSGIPQPRGVFANGGNKVIGQAQIMGVAAPDHGVWMPILTYGTNYIQFEGVGTSGQGRTDPDVLLWQDVIGVGGPTTNWTEFYISIQYEV
jgi:hypothetical protein